MVFVTLRSFWGHLWEPFRIPKMERQNGQNAAGGGQDAAECGQEAARMRKDLDPAKSSPLCTDFLQKSLQDVLQKRT